MIINEMGNKFGRLTVIGGPFKNKSQRGTWLCRCDCGKELLVIGKNLRNKNTSSCGCLRRDVISEERTKNLEGKKFNRLLVLSYSHSDKHQKVHWNCICDCGKEKIISGSALLSNKTKSCGCWNIERRYLYKGELHKNYNKNLSDDFRVKRRSIQGYKEWRLKVYEKFNYRCVICKSGDRKNKIHAHHINNYADNTDKILDVENGVVLCSVCHRAFHSEFGQHNNNKEQLDKFIRNSYSRCIIKLTHTKYGNFDVDQISLDRLKNDYL